jgi:hypothetical protein
MLQEENKPLLSAQIRAARGLIGWSAVELSRGSSVSLRTIQRAEQAESDMKLTMANNVAIRRALEAAGVEFTNGDQPGVRLAKRASSSSRANQAAKPKKGK